MIAEVAVSCAIFAIDQPYSYRIPQGMQILPGMRVVVPFGRANRRTEAIVLGVQTGSEDKLKAIEQLLDDAPVMTDEQLRLAAFVRERYFCTYYDAVKAILPAGLWFRQEKIYRIREDASDWRDTCRGRETECFVMQLLEDFGASAPETVLLNQMEDRQQAQAGNRLAAFQKTHRKRSRADAEAGRAQAEIRRDCRARGGGSLCGKEKAHRTRAGGGSRAARCGGRMRLPRADRADRRDCFHIFAAGKAGADYDLGAGGAAGASEPR